MSVREYIGARYVPLFMGDWDSTVNYEPLSIVSSQGNSYTSRQYVPAGTLLTNNEYWALTGNYNAQIEQYRQEVTNLSSTVGGYRADIDANAQAIEDEATTRETADTALGNRITEIESGSAGSIQSLQTAINTERADRIQADAGIVTRFDNYYNKVESDERYALRQASTDDLLVCIGDSILAGWSDENPGGINAWDTYLAAALGYESENVFKNGIGGSGFASGTTFAQMVPTMKSRIEAANKSANDVKLVIVGGGVNDVRNNVTHTAMKQGVNALIASARTAFPNAIIHIFPMIIGNFGYGPRLADLEDDVRKTVLLQSASVTNKVVLHTGCWSWNYDGNDDGVSADRIHLLADGQKLVGNSMAVEINGGNAFNEGHWFAVTDINGNTITGGYRSGGTVTFSLQTNVTSTGSGNIALGVDKRYGIEDGGFSVSNETESGTRIFFWNNDGTFHSFQPLSNSGCYGNVTYNINSSWA